MVHHGCQQCGRHGGTLRCFRPPPGCAKEGVVLCTGCATNGDVYHGWSPYCYYSKTAAMAKYKLTSDELEELRVAFTANPYHGGCAARAGRAT